MKKNGKLVTLALFTFLMGSVPAFAREMTLQELGKEASGIQKDAGYVYIIGEYAFTSKFNIKTEDIMLSSSTIKAEDPTDPSKMVINQITRTYNDSYEATGWKEDKNALGTAKMPTKVNVKYIDYHYIKDLEKVDTDALVNNAENAVSTELFTIGKVSNGEVAVTIKDGKLKESIKKGMGSGVIPLLTGMLQNKQVQSIDFVYLADDGTKVTLTLDKSTLDTLNPEEWLDKNCEKIFGKSFDKLILADLIGKEFTATLNLAETDETEYVTKKDGTTVAEYIVKFDGKKQEVDTDKIVDSASKNTKLNKDMFTISFDSASHIVTTDVKDVSKSIKEGMGSGVIQTLIDVLGESDVQSIDFSCTTCTPKVTLTLDKDTLGDLDPQQWLTDNSQAIFGKDVDDLYTADLIGKEFTAKVNLKSYAEKLDTNPEEYIFKFTGKLKEINVDEIVKNATTDGTSKLNKSMFTTTYSDGKVSVTIVDVSKSIKEGMGSGVIQTLIDVLSKSDVQSIDFSCTTCTSEVTLTLDKDTLGDLDPQQWLTDNSQAIFGKDVDDLYTADLIGKSFTAKVNLKSYAQKVAGNKEEYTFNFSGTLNQVKSEDLANSIKEKINAGKVYTIGEVQGNNIEVTANDSDTPIKEGMGSGIIKALIDVLSNTNVQSIDFSCTNCTSEVTLTLDKDTLGDLDPQQWLTDNSQAIFGKEYSEQITNTDLNNKTFKVTVNLKSYAEFAGDSSQTTTYDVTIKLATRKVTLNYNNGSTTPSTTTEVVDGSSFAEPLKPTWDGHEFKFWYVDGQDETAYNFSTKVKSDITLKAKWALLTKSENYILEKHVSGQTAGNFESEYDEAQKIVNITVTKPSEDISSIALVSDVKELLEKEEVEKVVITYDGISKEFTNPETAESEVITLLEQIANNTLVKVRLLSVAEPGSTLKALDGKTLEVKVVIDPDDAKVDNNEKLTEISYKISFDVLTHKVTLNYADDETEQKVLDIDNYGKLTEENPTRDGYRFLGWFKEGKEEAFDLQTEITEDLKLTARWIEQYSVTLNYGYNEGESEKTETKLYDKDAELPTLPNRDENGKQYKFIGWYEDISSEDTLTTKVEKEVTVKAKWAEIVTEEYLKNLGVNAVKNGLKKQYDAGAGKVLATLDGNMINISFEGNSTDTVYNTLNGCGARTTLYTFLQDPKIKSIEVSFESNDPLKESMSVPVVEGNVSSSVAFYLYANTFLKPFQTATGINALEMTMGDVAKVINSIHLKINLNEGYVFSSDELQEYTFGLNITSKN